MTTTALGTALNNLRHTLLRQDGGGLTDCQLLECFVAKREEIAFEALLRRHGPMVLAVCRRVLRNEADVEDAFQATFLVLVRKAASVRPRGMVGNWLYGVAHSTALKARAMSIKRVAKEREAATRAKPEVKTETGEQLYALLDQELKALPDIYRAAIVLCDLEGKSIKEAARQLGCPQGTVGTRLCRGRSLLSRRLVRRGLTLSGGAIATAISQNAAATGVPPLLMSSTAKAATLAAAGQAVATGLISAKVAALTEGVLQAMFLTKLKVATAVLLIAGLMAFGIGQLSGPSVAAQQKDRQRAGAPAQKKDNAKDFTSWQIRTTLEGHADGVIRLAFASDGKTLASASDDSTVKVWDLATDKELVGMKEPEGGGIRGLAFAPDGKTLATAGGDKVVRLWDATKGNQLQEFRGHTAATYTVVFSPDGKTLVSGGGCANYPDKGQTGYGEIRLWDPATGKERTSIQSHTWPVAHLVFTPDGKTLISGGYDNNIKIWDWDGKAQPQERLTITVGQGQGIYDMALSPDSKTMIVASEGTVKLWDLATGKALAALEKSEYRDGWLWRSVAFAPDGNTVAAASPIQEWEDKDKKFIVQRRSDILLWDVVTGKLREKLRVDDAVRSLAFSPDGKLLVTGCTGKMRMPERITREEDIETEKRGVVKLWVLKKEPASKKR